MVPGGLETLTLLELIQLEAWDIPGWLLQKSQSINALLLFVLLKMYFHLTTVAAVKLPLQ